MASLKLPTKRIYTQLITAVTNWLYPIGGLVQLQVKTPVPKSKTGV